MGNAVSKGEFAALCNVSPSRVSQWISEGKLSGAALIGTGRLAKIDVDEASVQLGQRLDLSQRLGLNGISTRLPTPTSEPTAAAPATPLMQPAGSSVEDQIKMERLRQERIRTRQAEAADAEQRGLYMRTDVAKREMARIATTMATVFEASLPAMAQALAARFELPQRDVLHQLRAEYREMRTKASAQLMADAELEDETVEDDGADESEARGARCDGDGISAAAGC